MKGVNTEIQEPMHSSDSLKVTDTKLKTIRHREHTERKTMNMVWVILHTYVFVYLKNETTKNLISSSLFWHIMNFKSDIQKFQVPHIKPSSGSTQATGGLPWYSVTKVSLLKLGGPTDRLFQTLSAKVRVAGEEKVVWLGVRGGSLGPSDKTGRTVEIPAGPGEHTATEQLHRYTTSCIPKPF